MEYLIVATFTLCKQGGTGSPYFSDCDFVAGGPTQSTMLFKVLAIMLHADSAAGQFRVSADGEAWASPGCKHAEPCLERSLLQ